MQPAIRNPQPVSSLLGGAIGDALGASVEFLSISQIREKFGDDGITDYCEFPDGHGEFTDDTQMTLFTAEGLLRASGASRRPAQCQGSDCLPQATPQPTLGIATSSHQSYMRWLITQGRTPGYRDEWIGENIESGWLIKGKALHVLRAPGNTCLSSLESGIMGTIEKPINDSKGCGGIMRMAPVGLIINNPEAAFKYGCELAAITHGHPSGYLSAGFFAALIQLLCSGVNLEDAIDLSSELLKNHKDHEETLEAVEGAVYLFHQAKKSGLKTSELPELIEQLGQGWVAEETLAISLFCSLLYQNDFAKGVLASVNHSGDSDSTGAITGNILGLINGLDAIPDKWITKLHHANIVRQVGEDLATGCKGDMNNTDQEWWDKYPGF